MAIEAHILSTRIEPQYTYQTFRTILLISVLANVAVALAMMIKPGWVAELINLTAPQPIIWMRYGGLMILILTGTYLPSLIAPQTYTFMGFYTGILRLILVVFFLIAGREFLIYAAYDGFFGILLLASYYRAYMKELMSFP